MAHLNLICIMAYDATASDLGGLFITFHCLAHGKRGCRNILAVPLRELGHDVRSSGPLNQVFKDIAQLENVNTKAGSDDDITH